MKRGPDLERLFDPRGKMNAARFAAKVAGCVACGGVSLYRVGSSGYCKVHRAEATRHAKKLQTTGEWCARVDGTEVTEAIDGAED